MFCDRCNFTINYKGDYLFNDGIFFGDNGDRSIFRLDEVICIHCLTEDQNEINTSKP